jgi:hypothetical protein
MSFKKPGHWGHNPSKCQRIYGNLISEKLKVSRLYREIEGITNGNVPAIMVL